MNRQVTVRRSDSAKHPIATRTNRRQVKGHDLVAADL